MKPRSRAELGESVSHQPGDAALTPAPELSERAQVSEVQLATPGPAGLVRFEGHADPVAFLEQLVAQYGDVVRYQTRMGPCFLFIRPEHVQTILHRETYRRASLVKMTLGNGLLASDGPLWRSQRRLMQPEFFPASIAPFATLIARETSRMAGAWHAAGQAGEPLDVSVAMTRLTLRIIVKALFSDDLAEAKAADLCAAVTQTIEELGQLAWSVFGAPVRVTPGGTARFAAGIKAIDSVCYEMIARRRALPTEARPRDLLTLLIQAEADGRPLSDRQLRDEIVTMLVGGHETTALSLAWTWKTLAEHPDVVTALQREVDAVLGGRAPELADLPALCYTRAVFQETLRLYPPVWYMSRVAEQDHVINGHAVPRGACVMVCQWLTHRLADLWPNPERFDPTRFTNPAAQPAHRYAFFPFGGGRHQCLGIHLALMEGTMILAHLAQQFSIRPVNGQQIKRELSITLRQSPGLVAKIEPRKVRSA